MTATTHHSVESRALRATRGENTHVLANIARRWLTCTALSALTACSMIGVETLPSPGRPPPTQPAPPGAPPGASSAPAPSVPAPSAPTRPRNDTSGATQQLLQQSRTARAAGDYGQATATTERALRIDPNNASLWLELGEIALATGDERQAATLARKAQSLAAGDRTVTAQADRLLRAAGTR